MFVLNAFYLLALPFLFSSVTLLFLFGKTNNFLGETFITREKYGEFIIYHTNSFSNSSVTSRLCLSSFTDMSRLHRFPFLAQRWQGPSSIAIIVQTQEDAEVAAALIVAVHKNEQFRNTVFHLTHNKEQKLVICFSVLFF